MVHRGPVANCRHLDGDSCCRHPSRQRQIPRWLRWLLNERPLCLWVFESVNRDQDLPHVVCEVQETYPRPDPPKSMNYPRVFGSVRGAAGVYRRPDHYPPDAETIYDDHRSRSHTSL